MTEAPMSDPTALVAELLALSSPERVKHGVPQDVAMAKAAATIEAVTKERDALRESLLLTAGVLQEVGRRHMGTTVVFTGKWTHLGQHRVSDILDRADAALSTAKEQTDV